MKAKTRRKLEMGERALEFCRSYPEDTPGFVAAVGRLESVIARATQLATQQRDGTIEARMATEQKRELRRALRSGHLDHLKRVAQAAGSEVPELWRKFMIGSIGTYYDFRMAAKQLVLEAEANKETLVKYGLSDAVLTSLNRALEQFDAAMDRSTTGRKSHVGASAELDRLGAEVVHIVNVMDGLNRARYEKGTEPLGAWESMRTIFGPRQGGAAPEVEGATPTVPATGEVRPAA